MFGIGLGIKICQPPNKQVMEEKTESSDTVIAPIILSTEQEISTDTDTLKLASFNIKVFGKAKLEKPEVMNYIVKIIRHFDACAIQEIRCKKQYVLPTLINLLGEDWDFVISERLGRTSCKEQYGLVYRKSRLKVLGTFQTEDTTDLIHREPFVAYCRAGEFTFSIINIHTDPNELNSELNYLDDIFRAELLREDDAILMGDLNASYMQLLELGEVKNISWVIEDVFTNTSQTKSYDNILFNRKNCTEYISGGVFNFRDSFDLSREETSKISNHFPVYAYFKITF